MDRELINSCIEYILEHLCDGLTVGALAEHFHYSESYLNRCFKEATGKSAYEFILRLKMDQSAVDIKLRKDLSITDVGINYGYSASNYSTAFKKHHRLSPAQFRQSVNVSGMINPYYPQGHNEFTDFDQYNSQIKIGELPDMPVIYERVVGNYIDLKDKWPRFLTVNSRFRKRGTLYIERFYDDPAVAGVSGCIYDICLTADSIGESDSTTVIPGGKYAIYPFEGLIEDIFCAVQGVFSVWLPRSGYFMNRRYGLNIYHNIDINDRVVRFDLCIPVERTK
jgi:AraC family transcriptional regulator